MNLNKLAFVDIETTGISSHADRIIELGILIVENGKLVKKYNHLINPGRPVNYFITSITGIKTSDLEDAPSFEAVYKEVYDLIKDCTFVAHNVRFDYGFIKSELERCGISYNSPHFCTAKLSRVLYPKLKRHGLDFIIERHGIKCKNRHRAYDDAEVIYKFYKMHRKTLGEEALNKAINIIGKKLAWPTYVPREQIENLPTTPGVYVFYGENDAILYIGKSVNIKQRVISHFTDDLNSTKEMKLSKLVRKITALPTPGELGALIKESKMIKEKIPMYNRMLRRSQQMVVLRADLDSAGYKTINIYNTHEEDIKPDDVPYIYGIFKSLRQAKEALMTVSDEYKLCRKLLNLEKTKRSCFGYQLKKCNGACLSQESASLYNAKFDIAFSNLRLKKWPYEMPIAITEGNGELTQTYVVDKWCLFEVDESGSLIQGEDRFDLDLYKIIRSYIQNPKNQKTIQPYLAKDLIYD